MKRPTPQNRSQAATCHTTIGPGDLAYPVGLGALTSPPTLHVRGATPWTTADRLVAVVGARAASYDGVRRAVELSEGLTASGVLVCSGGALGIDAAAHVGAVRCAAPTVVWLGSPVEQPYPPRNLALFDEVLALGGALVSAQPAGMPILPAFFLRRNEYLARMCDAVVVVEAQPRSGSLSTARAARDAGKLVCAVPGSPGTDALLAAGAACVEAAAHVLDALDGRPYVPRRAGHDVGSPEALTLAALTQSQGPTPLKLEDLATRAGLAVPRAQAALALLELEGLVTATSTGSWRIQSS